MNRHANIAAPTAEQLASRLEVEEREYRARKARRARRGLSEAADQLRLRLAGRRDVSVEPGSDCVAILLPGGTRLELGLRINFDHDGTMHQWFTVRECTAPEHGDYSEPDAETLFPEQPDALKFIAAIATAAG